MAYSFDGTEDSLNIQNLSPLTNVIATLKEQGVSVDLLQTKDLPILGAYQAYYKACNETALLVPLNNYLSDTEVGRNLYDSVSENTWKALELNGNIYGIRGLYILRSIGESFYINKELAEKYGWDFEKSISDQLDIAVDVAENDDAYIVGDIQYLISTISIHSFDNISSIYWDEDTNKVKIITGCEEYRERVNTLVLLNANGILKKSSTLLNETFFIYSLNSNSIYKRNLEEAIICDDYFDNITAIAVMSNKQEIVHQPSDKIGVCIYSENPDMAFELLATACLTRILQISWRLV